MIGIYLLVTIISQFSPVSQATTYLVSAFKETEIEQTQISVSFDAINDLHIGSPVLVDGRQVGEVAGIETALDSSGRYTVELELESSSLGNNLVALQTTPMSSSRKPETVIEVFSMPEPRKSAGDQIQGYSSLEDFWTASS